jgi:hypothetical protein
MNFKRFWKWYYIVPAAIVLAPIVIVIVVVVFGGIVMLLWNWLLPQLFGLPEIDFWQGFGLLALGRILFGGFGKGGGGGSGGSKPMTPEERERVRRRFCRAPAGDEPAASGTAAQSE